MIKQTAIGLDSRSEANIILFIEHLASERNISYNQQFTILLSNLIEGNKLLNKKYKEFLDSEIHNKDSN